MNPSHIKNIVDQVPIFLLMGVGGGLFILSLYSMAAASVIEHLKGRIRVRSRKLVQKLLKGKSREMAYAHERTD